MTHVGQLLCGGFQGVTVTPQAYHLIVHHHVSTMILLRKNAVSVSQMSKLIRDLQHIAHTQANYKYPLIFVIDEEGGMMNSLFDSENLTQFPGAMALAATGDQELVYEVSKALARELKQIGFSVILGPVLDVITKLSHQLVGVRSFGTTIEEVTKYGKACARGFRDGGLFTVGKHFPGIGNASVDSLLELPMMTDSLDQIKYFNSVPFAELIKDGLLDGISAAGCGVPTISPDETHACLSPVIINQLLRQDLNFSGVVISECLEMDALYHSIGLGQGVILAIYAGCDLVMVCHDKVLQDEAVESMEKAMANGNLDEETIAKCLLRIENIQRKLPSWEELFLKQESTFRVLYPELWEDHQNLSKKAYQKSITLVRDYTGTLPLTKFFQDSKEPENVLILSPLLNPIYPEKKDKSENPQTYPGEEVFQRFGELLSNHPSIDAKNPINVLHTTYTANGLTALHESLIENSKVVIVLTSEASRNMYQIGIVKYVSILCGANPSSFSSGSTPQLSKPLIIIATLSPYDFFYNKNIGSAYLCCYDYTNNVLEQVVGALMGDFQVDGCIPGEKKFVSRLKKRKLTSSPAFKRKLQPKRRWLVDDFDISRDWSSLVKLYKNNASDIYEETPSDAYFKKLSVLLSKKTQKHFVVRNASLNILYGVILTWIDEYQDISLDGIIDKPSKKMGSIMFMLVDKQKRLQSIGKNLHARAMRYLVKELHCDSVELGCSFPLVANSGLGLANKAVTTFFNSMGWDLSATSSSKQKHTLILNNMTEWSVPQKIFRELMIVGVRFDICTQPEKLMALILKATSEDDTTGDHHRIKQMYMEAVKYLSNQSPYEAKVIIALEPTNQNVIGSIILFTNRSPLATFYPTMDDANMAPGEYLGGIVAPIIDPSYSNLTDIFKFGLICSGITLLKSSLGESKITKCLMVGVDDEKTLSGIKEIGFVESKLYYDYYDQKKNPAQFLEDEK